MRVELTLSASRELAASAAWYEERTENQGVRFAMAVDGVLASLPTANHRRLAGFEDLGVLFVAFPKRWPYRVLFVARGDLLAVFAIAHNRRAPGYWLNRLDEVG